MKRHFLLALSALMIMALLPQKANAGGNDYLEKEYHYQYDDRPYKVIEDDHVIIIRSSNRYDPTGRRLNK